jgi:FAD/FMN-containing dehydrogenase
MAHVADVDRSVEFYTLLGFVCDSRFSLTDGTTNFASLISGQARLMLARANATVDPSQQAVLFYMYTEDVSSLREHLLLKGLNNAGPPPQENDAEKSLMSNPADPAVFDLRYPFYMPEGELRVHDPDGYVLLIGQIDGGVKPSGISSKRNSQFELVNDVHSTLNETYMVVHHPASLAEIRNLIIAAHRSKSSLAICGGRHAMGGQQFAERGELLDMRRMNRMLQLDMDRGIVRVEAGIQWPDLIRGIVEEQLRSKPASTPRWGIAQKQTGANALTLGGALAANVHGRGLHMGPIVADVESFALMGPDGELIECSRTQNSELFSLAIGGYGLFGVITTVSLRLAPRRTLRRVVRIIDIEEAVVAAERRIRDGFIYGDYQFDIDPNSPDFLTKGVFSGYCPVEGDPEPPPDQQTLSSDNWLDLLTLAHTDKSRAFTLYAQHYLATDGQLYKSDTHQLSEYLVDYHRLVDQRMGAVHPGSEIITELYVPPERLVEFLRAAAQYLIERKSPVIYGTIRLIQPDTDTFLPWASQRFACIVFNLHVEHTASALHRAAGSFRGLIDLATNLGGSFFLTYHRYATAQQVERCYPRIKDFFAAKAQYDPHLIFQNDWFRYYAPHFADGWR